MSCVVSMINLAFSELRVWVATVNRHGPLSNTANAEVPGGRRGAQIARRVVRADAPPQVGPRQTGRREGRARGRLTEEKRRSERILVVALHRISRGAGHVAPVRRDL